MQPVAEAAALAREHGAVAAHRCRAGGRAACRSISPRSASTTLIALRAQARRAEGRRRADRPRRRQPAGVRSRAAARSGGGAPAPRTSPAIAGFGAAARGGARGPRADATVCGAARPARGAGVAAIDAGGRHRRPQTPRACPTRRASRCPASRPRRWSSRSISRASRSAPAPPARRARSAPAACWRRWGLAPRSPARRIRVSLGPQTTRARHRRLPRRLGTTASQAGASARSREPERRT